MPTPLAEATVVITGASSGVGRATALRFARRGARLALCARDGGPLAEVAAECEEAGAAGVVHEALDVADGVAVEGLAAAAEARFGSLDVWVNGAGTIAYGNFLDIPPDVFRTVIETDLMGQVNGARAALRRFVPQRSGVLINVSSTWGRVTSPAVSPYVVAKHAVRALSETLRGELEGIPGVHVTTISPQAIDTPIFDKAANYSGHPIRPIPPLLSADRVAAGIEACAERPRREVSYGRAGRALEVLSAVVPPLYRRFANPVFVAGTFGPGKLDAGDGNVLEPTGEHEVDGGWLANRRRELRGALFAAARAAFIVRSGTHERERPDETTDKACLPSDRRERARGR